MKLLITGSPKSGKSTILDNLVSNIVLRRGFITKEIVKDQRRTGFVAEDMDYRSVVLAQTENPTSLQVGRFHVQPEVLAQFTQNLSHPQVGELLYIDEIGQMQLQSDEFKSLVAVYLDAPNDFVATISSVYTDEFTERILKRDDVLFFQLTDTNRDDVKRSLSIALSNKGFFNELPLSLQTVVVGYANGYLNKNSYIPFRKLFTNAVSYFLDNRISELSTDTYVVKGNANEHIVHYKSKSDWSCDCPLSNGSMPYDVSADCSHVQAVRLFIANP